MYTIETVSLIFERNLSNQVDEIEIDVCRELTQFDMNVSKLYELVFAYINDYMCISCRIHL